MVRDWDIWFSVKTRSRPRPRPLETTSRDRDVKTEITSWLGPYNTEQTNKPNICISAPNIWSRDAERERSERQVMPWLYKLVSREECLQNDRLLFWMGQNLHSINQWQNINHNWVLVIDCITSSQAALLSVTEIQKQFSTSVHIVQLDCKHVTISFFTVLQNWPTVLQLYTVSQKKGATLTMAITLSIHDRFAKFFHCCKQQEISYKTNIRLPTTP